MSSENPQSIYDITVKDTYGNDVSLNKYKGMVLLIVNIASQCGLASSNYKQLTELNEKYKDQGKLNQTGKNIEILFSMCSLSVSHNLLQYSMPV